MSNNKTLKLLFLYNSVFCFASGLLGPLYALFVNGIDDKLIWVSVSWATSIFTTTIIVYVLTKIGDKYNPKHLLTFGYLFRAIAWTLFIFVEGVPLLIIAMIFVGIGEAFGTPAFNAVFAEHLDDGRHVAEYSDWTLISNIVVVASTVVGGFIVSEYGFKPIFMIMVVLALISAVGIMMNGNIFDVVKSSKRTKNSLFFKR